MNNASVPSLQPKPRDREYKQTSAALRDSIVYAYVFEGLTHRQLDVAVLGLSSEYSKGFVSMNILHHLGLIGSHRGIFASTEENEALEILRARGSFDKIVEAIERHIETRHLQDSKPEIRNGKSSSAVNAMGNDFEKQMECINLSETDRERLVKTRIGQSKFKQGLLEHSSKCKICGVRDERFLIASHIKPWSESDNQERLDLNNGFLLCPNHDVLFDRGYISFDDNGHILISREVDDRARIFLNVDHSVTITINSKQREYLKWHREHIFLDTSKGGS